MLISKKVKEIDFQKTFLTELNSFVSVIEYEIKM